MVRFVAILQLCCAFSVLLWQLAYPLMGELFQQRSDKLSIEYLIGEGALVEKISAGNPPLRQQLIENRALFAELPEEEQEALLKDHRALQTSIQASWYSKFGRIANHLLWDLSVWEQLWLPLALAIPICLLLGKSWAIPAAWLLPLLCCGMAIDLSTGPATPLPPESLYPTEEQLFAQQKSNPLLPSDRKSHSSLSALWDYYLVTRWSGRNTDSLPIGGAPYQQAVAEGRFAFHLAEWQREQVVRSLPRQLPSQSTILFYILWNTLFALTPTASRLRLQSPAASSPSLAT